MLTNFIPIRLVPNGPLVVDTANKHNAAFKRAWNSILKRIDNKELEITLRLDPSHDLILEQKVDGIVKLSQTFPSSSTLYGEALGAVTPAINACIVKITDPEVVLTLEDVYETYNGAIIDPNWFFCVKPVIRFFINEDQGSGPESFNMDIYFESMCDGTDAHAALTNPVFILFGQQWEAAV